MYLHLGQNIVVKQKDIIGIFDLDTTTVSNISRDFLAKAEKDKKVINVSYELPKSFIVTQSREQNSAVYISQISTSTLIKRTDFMKEFHHD